MPLRLIYTTQFKKDLLRVNKQGKEMEKLFSISQDLIDGQRLAANLRDHPLTGDWKNHRECHIGPDWLLIYQRDAEEVRLHRTGSHAELFGK